MPIVAIGASAGGLEALQELLSAMRFPCDHAIFVIQHLDPNRPGALVELLQRMVSVPVSEARHAALVKPDVIYVIPPGKNMTVKDGRIVLSLPTARRGMRLPIDNFFVSLADKPPAASVGVVLSGMGSDGTEGLRALQAAGCRTFAQSPESAKFDSMPQSAITAGVVDRIDTAAHIARHVLLPSAARATVKPEKITRVREAQSRHVILSQVNSVTGHDFSGYKPSVIDRRIERRIAVHKLSSEATYAAFIQHNTEEAVLLAASFSIGVTSFFRDPRVWEFLERKLLPKLLAAPAKDRPFRVWMAGCATGEEAYTLAIVFAEARARHAAANVHSAQIFATDIDPVAIEKARTGLYERAACKDLPPEILQRWFAEDGDQYRIRQEIREMIVFAKHDVTSDPSFTKLDLVVCRNVLIYLAAQLQKTLFDTFHYSLSPGGILLLGASESVPADNRSFAQIDGHYKVYRRLERGGEPGARAGAHAAMRGRRPSDTIPNARHSDLRHAAEKALLQVVMPAAVVVSRDGDIVHILGKLGKYFEPTTGRANLNVHAMARGFIRRPLLEAMLGLIKGRARTVIRDAVSTRGGRTVTRIRAMRLTEAPLRGMMLVAFSEVKDGVVPRSKSAVSASITRTQRLLERELDRLRQDKQIVEEQAAGVREESQAVNEELQASNEELMTSKEEAQSINEELQIVNAELNSKLERFTRVNDDLRNLLESTDIAIVFLDSKIRIRKFTHQLERIWRLVPTDVGRSLADIKSNLNYPQLLQDVTDVLATLIPRERELTDSVGRWFLARVMPYRTTENVVDGVVATFSDISVSKKLEQELRKLNARVSSGAGDDE